MCISQVILVADHLSVEDLASVRFHHNLFIVSSTLVYEII